MDMERLRALPVQLIGLNQGVILKRGCTEFRVMGEKATEVIQLMLSMAANKGVSRAEICEFFAAPARPTIEQLIEQLVVRRILVSSENVNVPVSDIEANLDVFYWHFGESAARVTERLNNRRIAILGINCISRQLVTSLRAADIEGFDIVDYPLLRNLRLFNSGGELISSQWADSSKPPLSYEEWVEKTEMKSLDCVVATSDFGNHQVLREWNKFCVKHHCIFFPAVLQNLIGYVGPLVIPGETACFECLRARQNANFENPEAQSFMEAVAFEGQGAVGFHPSMASILGDLVAIELNKFYSGILPNQRVGFLIEVNLLIPRLTTRKILKIPRCVVCSPLNTRSSMTPKGSEFVPPSRPRP